MSQRLRVEWKRTTLDMPRCDRTAATDTTKAYGNSSKITSRFLCTFKLHSIYDYSLSCSTTPVLLWDNYVQVVPVISVTTSSVDAVYHATRRQHSFDDTATFLWPPYVIGGHYVFALWFLSIFYLSSFFIPRLISAASDWMSTILLHMVCKFRMQVWNVLRAARWKCRSQKSPKKSIWTPSDNFVGLYLSN